MFNPFRKKKSSGVIPMSVKEVHQPDKDQYIICTQHCRGVLTIPKTDDEKKKHEVYIPLETAKRLIEKKRISRLERQIPLPVIKERYFDYFRGAMSFDLLCPRCGLRIKTNVRNKKEICKYCFQRVDFKEVTKDA